MRPLVIIPYITGPAQGSELELAVAGWRVHFKSPYKLVIVGDRPAFEMLPGEVWIPCPLVPPIGGQYMPHVDITQKFLTALEHYPRTVDMIYACDDMYAVKDFTLDDVKIPKYSQRHVPHFDWWREGEWLGDLGKTRDALERYNLPQANYVCHLPVYYNANRLRDFIEYFNADEESWVIENLYYNHYCYKNKITGEMVPQRGSKWKYEVQTSSPGIQTAEEANAIWITNGNCGWSEELERLLRKHYGL